MMEPGIESCLTGIENHEEHIYEVVEKVMTHKKCSKVVNFGQKLFERIMQSNIDFDNIESFSNFMNGITDGFIRDACSFKNELRECVEDVLVPGIDDYIKYGREVDGCCAPFSMDLPPMREIVKSVFELMDIAEGLVCGERQPINKYEKSQTCGYTFLQGVFQKGSGPETWLKNIMPMLQIPTDQACSAFMGKKFKNTKNELEVMMPHSPLRNCGKHFDNLFLWIDRSFPKFVSLFVPEDMPYGATIKNILEMFHMMAFGDDKCLRIESIFVLFRDEDCSGGYDDTWDDFSYDDESWNDDGNKPNDDQWNYHNDTVSNHFVAHGAFRRLSKTVGHGSRTFLENILKINSSRQLAPAATVAATDHEGGEESDVMAEMLDMCITMPTNFAAKCKMPEVKKCTDDKKKKFMFTDGKKKRRIKCRNLMKFDTRKKMAICKSSDDKFSVVEDFCRKTCQKC